MSRARLGGTTFARSATPSNRHSSLSDVCSAVDNRFWSVDLVFFLHYCLFLYHYCTGIGITTRHYQRDWRILYKIPV
jgi:hypothetical protein